MTKYINKIIANLIFAATIVERLLSLLYIFITQPMVIWLKGLFSRFNLGGKCILLDSYKSCSITFSYSGIGQTERKLVMGELGCDKKRANLKLFLAYNYIAR